MQSNSNNASSSSSSIMQVHNIITPAGSSSSNNGKKGSEVLSKSEAQAAKRRDVIVELLKELVRVGVNRINFVDLIVDYIVSGEFRYSQRNEVIGKFFVGDEMLSDHELEDYSLFRSLDKLYQQRPTRDDLKGRIDNLNLGGEAFACMYQSFLEVINDTPVLFGCK